MFRFVFSVSGDEVVFLIENLLDVLVFLYIFMSILING